MYTKSHIWTVVEHAWILCFSVSVTNFFFFGNNLTIRFLVSMKILKRKRSMMMMWLHVQESDKYKSMVQQHVDLETIQSKLHKDAYSSCALSFYRDLLLLFNNAVVFFPKSSLESLTAHQLRRLVLYYLNIFFCLRSIADRLYKYIFLYEKYSRPAILVKYIFREIHISNIPVSEKCTSQVHNHCW